ncbi:MAG: TonB family protein [Bryobacteraceae bacterium]
MEHYGTLIRLVTRLFTVIAVLSEATCAFGACNAHPYRVARTLVDNASDVAITLSVRHEDFAPRTLVCLAGTLRERYPGRNISASIFSSYDAALGYLPGSLEVPPRVRRYQSELHALYSYNRETHEEYLEILPEGLDRADSIFTTRIDLPAKAAPACKLAITGRCLLEFEHIDYPSAKGMPKISGQVTLAGSIRSDGKLSGVTVEGANVSPAQSRAVLVDAALQNFRTWRFEPAEQQNTIRVTYDFEVTNSPLVGYEHPVEFRLPEVKIWTPSATLNHFAEVVSSTPSTGTGSAQAFTFLFSHPGGFSAITEAWFGVYSNSNSAIAPACSGYFKAATNTLYLWDEAQTQLVGPMALNASGSLRNSSCIIDSAGSSATGSGNNLSLTISFTFLTAFAGPKTISLSTTAGSHNSPRVKVATWTVP